MFAIEKINNVHIYTDQSSTEFYNNVIVIEELNSITIIDTFIKKKTMKKFLDIIEEYNKPIERVIFTHWHIDHTLGAFFLKDHKIYSNLRCKNQLVEFVEKYQEMLREKGVIEDGVSIVIPNNTFEDKLEIPMDNNEVLLLESVPGHCYDSILIHYNNILIVGDNLVGKEVDVLIPPAIPPDEGKSKLEDLIKVIDYIEKIDSKYIIYGHGKRLNPKDILSDNRKRLSEKIKIKNKI